MDEDMPPAVELDSASAFVDSGSQMDEKKSEGCHEKCLGERDCCLQPCCLCAPCKDDPILKSPICMVLRTNDLVRLLVAVLLALLIGCLIGMARPVKPGDRSCILDIASETIRATPSSTQDNCADLGWVERTIGMDDLSALKKKIPMCLDNETNVQVSSACDVVYNLNASSSDDVAYCYGSRNNLNMISFDDTKDCQKFGMFGKDAILNDVIYTDGPLTESTTSPAFTPGSITFHWSQKGHGSNQCLTTSEGCVGMIYTIAPFKEDPISSVSVHEQYVLDSKAYNDIIYYLFKFPGGLWLQALQLVIMPLLIAGVIVAVANLKDLSGAGRLGCGTFCYYLLTTLLAAIESLILCTVFLVPFLHDLGMTEVATSAPKQAYGNTGEQITSVIHSMVPTNGVKAMFDGNYLGVIFFSIIAGCAMTNPQESTFLKWFQELSDMMLKVVDVLISLSPLGVFCMCVYLFAYNDIATTAAKAGLFLGCIFTGLFCHCVFVYPMIYFLVTRKNPYIYWYNILEAACFALVISSSLVTLPLTLKCAKEKNKISHDIADFVCTLGATINMDGTTIGFPIAIIFCAFGQGIHLGFGQMVMIVILSTVSSMGAAPIPQSGLVLLIVMLDNLGIPLEGPFTIVMAVDWIYDRPETMTNIVGDSFAAGVLDHIYRKYEATPDENRVQADLVRQVSKSIGDDTNNQTAIASEA